jgi:hypothetical protein
VRDVVAGIFVHMSEKIVGDLIRGECTVHDFVKLVP